MRRSALPLLVALVLVVAACAGATTDPSPQPSTDARVLDTRGGEQVTLAVGTTARFDQGQFSVTFRRVSQDSRCPGNARCVWAGDAAVQLWLTRGWRSAATTLHTFDGAKTAELDGYTVRLVSLEPYPMTEPIPEDAYLLTLRVDGPAVADTAN